MKSTRDVFSTFFELLLIRHLSLYIFTPYQIHSPSSCIITYFSQLDIVFACKSHPPLSTLAWWWPNSKHPITKAQWKALNKLPWSGTGPESCVTKTKLVFSGQKSVNKPVMITEIRLSVRIKKKKKRGGKKCRQFYIFFGFYLHLLSPLKWYLVWNQRLEYSHSTLNIKQLTSVRVAKREILPPRLFSISTPQLIHRREKCTHECTAAVLAHTAWHSAAAVGPRQCQN